MLHLGNTICQIIKGMIECIYICVYNVYEYNIIQKTKIHKYFHIHLQENILEVKFLAKKMHLYF